jgi:hypothetical protein
MELFKRASVLDQYTNDEATNRLRPLKSLRLKRAGETERHLEDMIDNENFKGMGAFLRPFSKSTNAIDKKKYTDHKSRIEKAIKDRSSRAHAKLGLLSSRDDVVNVADAIRDLQDANKEVSFIFDSWHFSPSKEVASLKDKLSTRLCHLTDAVQEGCKLSDCYMMAKNQHMASIILEGAEPFLSTRAKEKFRFASSKMTDTLEEIPKQIADSGLLCSLTPVV